MYLTGYNVCNIRLSQWSTNRSRGMTKIKPDRGLENDRMKEKETEVNDLSDLSVFLSVCLSLSLSVCLSLWFKEKRTHA